MTPPKKLTKTKGPHPLERLVPPMWFYDEYYPRDIKGVTDLEVLEYARISRMNTLIFGPTGPGKTSAVYAFAALHKIPLVYTPCNGAVDPSTLFCRVLVQPDGTYQYVETDLTTGLREGCIWLLDEVNFLPARIAAVAHGGLDKRRQVTIVELNETIDLNPGTQIVATYNPDYSGTRPLNEAFRNRFGLKLHFDYDPEIESKMTMLTSLGRLAAQLREAKNAGDLDTPTATNMLLEFEQVAYDMGKKFGPEVAFNFAVENFINSYSDDERPAVKNQIVDLFADDLKSEMEAWWSTEK